MDSPGSAQKWPLCLIKAIFKGHTHPTSGYEIQHAGSSNGLKKGAMASTFMFTPSNVFLTLLAVMAISPT